MCMHCFEVEALRAAEAEAEREIAIRFLALATPAENVDEMYTDEGGEG